MARRLEGYASLFGVSDQIGDVVRAGAFRASLARTRDGVPMLLRHDPKLVIGRWRELGEDSRGLFVRGEMESDAPAASLARRLLDKGLDGLSIGFTARQAKPRLRGGRDLIEIDLWEVSLVAFPMLPQARLTGVERSAPFVRERKVA